MAENSATPDSNGLGDMLAFRDFQHYILCLKNLFEKSNIDSERIKTSTADAKKKGASSRSQAQQFIVDLQEPLEIIQRMISADSNAILLSEQKATNMETMASNIQTIVDTMVKKDQFDEVKTTVNKIPDLTALPQQLQEIQTNTTTITTTNTEIKTKITQTDSKIESIKQKVNNQEITLRNRFSALEDHIDILESSTSTPQNQTPVASTSSDNPTFARTLQTVVNKKKMMARTEAFSNLSEKITSSDRFKVPDGYRKHAITFKVKADVITETETRQIVRSTRKPKRSWETSSSTSTDRSPTPTARQSPGS